MFYTDSGVNGNETGECPRPGDGAAQSLTITAPNAKQVHRLSKILIICGVIVTFPFSMWLCLHVIREYECGIVFRYGKIRFSEVLTPGLYFLLPLIDKCVVVDMRVAVFCLPKQEAHTKDGVCVKLDAVCTYQIVDALKAVLDVENVREIVKSLAHNMLCQAVEMHTLTQIACSTDQIAYIALELLDATTKVWGIQIRHFEVRGLVLPKTVFDTKTDVQDQAVRKKAAEISKELRGKISPLPEPNTSQKQVKCLNFDLPQ